MANKKLIAFRVASVFIWSACVLLSLPMFFTPFLSLNGSPKGYHTVKDLHLYPGRYILQMRTSVQNTDYAHHKMTLGVYLFTPHDERTGECPNSFHEEIEHRNFYSTVPASVSCLQTGYKSVSYLPFRRDSVASENDYRGPNERSQDVVEARLDLHGLEHGKKHRVYVLAQLFDFGKSSLHQETCVNDTDCDAFAMELKHHMDDSPIFDSNPRAICLLPTSPDDSKCSHSGCGAAILFGDSSCRGSSSYRDGGKKKCEFLASFMVFHDSLFLLRSWSVWTWEVVLFVGVLCFLLFGGYAFAFDRHKKLLDHYHIRSRDFKMISNRIYCVKLIITGRVDTHNRGSFYVRCCGDTIFEHPLNIFFQEEDFDGNETVVIRTKFYSMRSGPANFGVTWEGKFITAEFEEPRSQAIVHIQFPFSLKTRANLVFLPLFHVWATLAGGFQWGRIISRNEYTFLVAFLSFLNATWLVPLLFALILVGTESEWVWGTVDSSPPLPIVFACLFVVSIFVTLGMVLLREAFERKREPVMHRMQSFVQHEASFVHRNGVILSSPPTDRRRREKPSSETKSTRLPNEVIPMSSR